MESPIERHADLSRLINCNGVPVKSKRRGSLEI